MSLVCVFRKPSLNCLYCSLCKSIGGGVIGCTGDMTYSVSLQECLELGACEACSIIRDNNLRQTMCCEYGREHLNSGC